MGILQPGTYTRFIELTDGEGADLPFVGKLIH